MDLYHNLNHNVEPTLKPCREMLIKEIGEAVFSVWCWAVLCRGLINNYSADRYMYTWACICLHIYIYIYTEVCVYLFVHAFAHLFVFGQDKYAS